jgi:hypothetical protein
MGSKQLHAAFILVLCAAMAVIANKPKAGEQYGILHTKLTAISASMLGSHEFIENDFVIAFYVEFQSSFKYISF